MQQPDYSISTPENVDLHLEIAGLGNRLLAQLVDSLINLLTAFIVIVSALITGFLISTSPLDAQSKNIWYGVLAMISIFIIFIQLNCYFIVFEAIWQGQTPGKKVAEIRVIEANGQPIGWAAAIIRNLIRMVDQILFLGLLVMLFDKNERRLGDMAAGTIVIREHKPDISTTQLLLAAPAGAADLLDIGRVTPGEYDLIVDFLKRRKSLTKAYRPLVAQKLAKYFHEKLGSAGDENSAPENYLEQVFHSYQARANE
jgi:uncharacterized RDD family membrane protein YckC